MFQEKLNDILKAERLESQYAVVESGGHENTMVQESAVNNHSSDVKVVAVGSRSDHGSRNNSSFLTPLNEKAYKLIMLAAAFASVSHFVTEGPSDPAQVNGLWALALMAKWMDEFNYCETACVPATSLLSAGLAVTKGMLSAKNETYNFLGAASFIPLLINDFRLLCKFGEENSVDKYKVAGGLASGLSKLFASVFFLTQLWKDQEDSDENSLLFAADFTVPIAILFTSVVELYSLAVTKTENNEDSLGVSLLGGEQRFFPSSSTGQHHGGSDVPGTPCPPMVVSDHV